MKRMGLAFIFLLCNIVTLYPSPSKIYRWKGEKVLSKGTVENVTIDHKGIVSLSPGIDTVFKSTEIFLWDCVYDSRGNKYVSSGNEGKVFRITPNHQVFTVFSSEKGAEVYTLAVDKDDNIYIGESPSGIIYKLLKGGKPKEFYKTGEKYIWRLIFDRNGTLFAATGDRGKLLRISPDGKGEVYYRAKENHLISLYIFNDVMYAGTEPNGLFIEVQGKNRVVVLYDTKEDEVHSIVGMDRSIFFATVSKPADGGQSSFTSFFGANPLQENKKNEKSIVYRFDIDKGTVTPLWECPTPPIYTMAGFKAGKFLIGTEDGRLYVADKDGWVDRINKFEESPVLNIVKGKENQYFILTGKLGNVIEMGNCLSLKGKITSDVFDTGRKSIFGSVESDVDIPKGTSFSLSLRVGNKENPGEDWTDWKVMKKDGKVNLPTARFIQIRCELRTGSGGKSPFLRGVTISYLPENRSPLVKEIIVCPVGVSGGENSGFTVVPLSLLPEKEKNFYKALGYNLPVNLYRLEKGKRCACWKAIDPDKDSLSFSFFYRGENEKKWKCLKDKLKKTSYVWDETTLPNGIYYCKVLASDVRENPASRALKYELISEPFVIDNSLPVVQVNQIKAKGNKIEVKVSANDDLSILRSAAYAVNGGEWNVIIPEDGIFDSREEKFFFTLVNKEKGEYTVVVKAKDMALNTGTGKGTVELK